MMDKNTKRSFNAGALRAYIMLGVLALIWLAFDYATSKNCPPFWDVIWHGEGLARFGTAIGEQFRYFFVFDWVLDGHVPVFDWIPNGIFLQPRNLSNLMTQMSVTGVIAVGMLMVIVSGNIDLSAGSVLGFAGGVAAIMMSVGGFGLAPAIAAAIAVGLAIGIFHGSLVAYRKIPAFIVTLGGLLAWRGAVKWLLGGNTVAVSDENFKAIGNTELPSIAGWVLAAIAVAFVLSLAYRRARNVEAYGLGKPDYVGALTRALVPVLGTVAFIAVMNAWRGVPIPVLILVGVALLGAFIMNSTVFGRYLYAIGGNAEAARYSGINDRREILKVYAVLGAFIGVAALIFTARVGSAAPDAGVLKELDAIAACVIGGASLMGGRGTVFGACLGALIMASLDNGMSLLNVRDFLQDIIKGGILVAAVGLDMAGRRQS